jgi:hypothetical protein
VAKPIVAAFAVSGKRAELGFHQSSTSDDWPSSHFSFSSTPSMQAVHHHQNFTFFMNLGYVAIIGDVPEAADDRIGLIPSDKHFMQYAR